MGMLHKVGKFYSRIMMRNIGIFIFSGLLFVLFHEQGWFPNEDIYAMSELVYAFVIPIMIAYEGGRLSGGDECGVIAVIAECGVLAASPSGGILGAMIMAPLAGFCWRKQKIAGEKAVGFFEKRLKVKVSLHSLEMLRKNLQIACAGALLALLGFYVIEPGFAVLSLALSHGITAMIENDIIWALSLIIEPAKVFFLNNLIHHGILVPIGLEQLRETGSSILFLLETNPGPGFGMILALYLTQKKRRSEYASAGFAQLIGGVHEVYFPFVLSNLRLLIPVLLGGIAGSVWFSVWKVELAGVVSPGSILTLMILSGRKMFLWVVSGVLLSAAVSCLGSLLVLTKWKSAEDGEMADTVQKEELTMEKERPITSVAIVCDGGMGSSAMGAALLRRVLREKGITDIKVQAYAGDLVPESETFLVCQQDYYSLLPQKEKKKEVVQIKSMTSRECYLPIAEMIAGRR